MTQTGAKKRRPELKVLARDVRTWVKSATGTREMVRVLELARQHERDLARERQIDPTTLNDPFTL